MKTLFEKNLGVSHFGTSTQITMPLYLQGLEDVEGEYEDDEETQRNEEEEDAMLRGEPQVHNNQPIAYGASSLPLA